MESASSEISQESLYWHLPRLLLVKKCVVSCWILAGSFLDRHSPFIHSNKVNIVCANAQESSSLLDGIVTLEGKMTEESEMMHV